MNGTMARRLRHLRGLGGRALRQHNPPNYLDAAIREVDAFFEELAKHTMVQLRYACDTPTIGPLAA